MADATIRYGPRPVGDAPSATSEIWSTAVTAVWRTDPERIAAVLPPPLEPTDEPLVRLTISSVELAGLPAFGAAWFGVHARHGDDLGEYPLFMPMTTEQSVIGGRERYGEPKKLADVTVHLDGDRVEASVARMGATVCEIHGRLGAEREPYERTKRDFWFKVFPGSEPGGALDLDPLLIYGEKTEKARVHRAVDGNVVLKEAPLDPVADLVVRRLVDLNWTERTSTQVGRVVRTVPRDDLAPYLHQRHDDLSLLRSRA